MTLATSSFRPHSISCKYLAFHHLPCPPALCQVDLSDLFFPTLFFSREPIFFQRQVDSIGLFSARSVAPSSLKVWRVFHIVDSEIKNIPDFHLYLRCKLGWISVSRNLHSSRPNAQRKLTPSTIQITHLAFRSCSASCIVAISQLLLPRQCRLYTRADCPRF